MNIAPDSKPVDKAVVPENAAPAPLTDRLVLAKNADQIAAIVFETLSKKGDLDLLAKGLEDRAKMLGASSLSREISSWIPVHRGIFGSETTIKASSFAEPIRFNDPALYGREFLVAALQQFCTQAAAPEILRGSFANVALWTQGNYFDSFRSQETSPGERERFLMNLSETLDIAELRGKRFVKCAERAPAYASVMAVLGFDVITVCSECKIGNEPDMHVFNVVASHGKFIITDPTSPVICRYEDGRRSYAIAAYEIPSDQIDTFINGGEITVTHRDWIETSPGKFELSEPAPRVYRGARREQDIVKDFFAQNSVKF